MLIKLGGGLVYDRTVDLAAVTAKGQVRKLRSGVQGRE